MEQNAEVMFTQENYTKKHSSVVDMFSDFDLTAVLKEFGHASSDWLSNYIFENLSTLPKKQQGVKRKAETSILPESFDQAESDEVSSDEEENTGSFVRDVMLGEMLTCLKSELYKAPALDVDKYGESRELLLDTFPSARAEFVKRIVAVFKGRFVACALACFFVENKIGSKIQKYAPELNQAFWIKTAKPTTTKRKSKRLTPQHECNGAMKQVFQRYQKVIEQFYKKYPEMFEDGRLIRQSTQLELDSSKTEKKLECPVCFENCPVSKMVCCNIPVVDSNANVSAFGEIPTNQPSTSLETTSETINKDTPCDLSGLTDEFAAHTFCRSCIRSHAVAATQSTPLADGGVGLKCMVPNCKNPILYSEIRHFLKKDTKKKLDERITEEILGLASLKNLERCHKCNFRIEMDVPPEVNKVFHCPSCSHQFCRFCKSDWDDEHIGVTCDELSVKQKKDRKDRNLEQRLNEAIIRKCPQCSIAFTKSEGCNKMTCRCGCTQCYICRETNINYTHFCQHFRDPEKQEVTCKQCPKTCLLWEDSTKHDNQTIENIKKQLLPSIEQAAESSAKEDEAIENIKKQLLQSAEQAADEARDVAAGDFMVPVLPNNFANYGANQLQAGGNPFNRNTVFRDRFFDDDVTKQPKNLPIHLFRRGNDVANWVQTGGQSAWINPTNQQPANHYPHPYHNNNYENTVGGLPQQNYANPYVPMQQQMPYNNPPIHYQIPQLAQNALLPQQNPFLQQIAPALGNSRESKNKGVQQIKHVENFQAVYDTQVNPFQISNYNNPSHIQGIAKIAAGQPNLYNGDSGMNGQETGPYPEAGNAHHQPPPQMFVGLMMPPVDDAIAEFDEFLLNYVNNPNKEAFQQRRRQAQIRGPMQNTQPNDQNPQQPSGSGLNGVGAKGQNNNMFDYVGNNQ